MPRLVVNPGSPTAWEIQLKPGVNFIGRGFANDVKIPDGSVSGSHCQITVGDSGAVIKDLGSTNGTFVNRAPVREAPLASGQNVRLGGVEMMFYSDAPAPQTASAPVSLVSPRPAIALAPTVAPISEATIIPAEATTIVMSAPPLPQPTPAARVARPAVSQPDDGPLLKAPIPVRPTLPREPEAEKWKWWYFVLAGVCIGGYSIWQAYDQHRIKPLGELFFAVFCIAIGIWDFQHKRKKRIRG
jgi:predicted component of type VI protein secretion system